MTFDERVEAIADHGFTPRQAGFLVTVMLHSGVCLGRHYCAYARITHGAKAREFFEKLLARQLATRRRCGHNTAWLYRRRALGHPRESRRDCRRHAGLNPSTYVITGASTPGV